MFWDKFVHCSPFTFNLKNYKFSQPFPFKKYNVPSFNFAFAFHLLPFTFQIQILVNLSPFQNIKTQRLNYNFFGKFVNHLNLTFPFKIPKRVFPLKIYKVLTFYFHFYFTQVCKPYPLKNKKSQPLISQLLRQKFVNHLNFTFPFKITKLVFLLKTY